MRFISIDNVREQMMLAHPLFDKKGNILLNSNVVLTERMIQGIKDRGFKGVYIFDEISKGIATVSNISTKTKITALQALQTKNLDDCMFISHALVDDLKNTGKIYTSLNLVQEFDSDTYFHSLNVAVYAGTFGIIYGLPPDRVELLVTAALLHDIGKSQIPIEVLNKPGKLTEDERELVNLHPEYGYEILKDSDSISSVVRVSVLEHHENEDGSGYPNGYDKKKIYLFAKIIHICDVYEAMLSKRSYKKRLNPSDVIEYMMGNAGTMFNKELLEVFVKNLIPYPEGMLVMLSTEESAVIKKNNRDFPTRPLVITLSGKVINLIKHPEITITGYEGMN